MNPKNNTSTEVTASQCKCVHPMMRSIMPKGCRDMPFVTLGKPSSGVKTKETVLADHSLARGGLRLCEPRAQTNHQEGRCPAGIVPEEITDAAGEKE